MTKTDFANTLKENTDIDSILVMVEKTIKISINDLKNIDAISIEDLTSFENDNEHIHRDDCVHSNKLSSYYRLPFVFLSLV